MRKRAIVYWLLPAKDKRELFCEIIRILCQELKAPNFEPHLTVAISNENHESPRKVLNQIRSMPIQLRVRRVAFASEFTKTLFVRFESNSSLDRFARQVANAAKVRPRRIADPHVSLLYKATSPKIKKELAAIIELPFGEVTFDSIAAVRVNLPVQTSQDVEAWKIVARQRLTR